MKEKLFDTIPIVMTETYVGYGKDDLNEMTLNELKTELKRTESEIARFEDELANTRITTPSFVLKERIKDAEFYKKKIEYKIARLFEDKEEEKKEGKAPKVYRDKLTDYK